METLSYVNQNDYSKMFGYIKKALECMKELAVVEFKCTSINDAMQLTEKNDLWEVLQKELQKHKNFICNTTRLTGLYVKCVDKEYYEKIFPEEIKCQLKEIKKIVYLKHIHDTVSKDAIKNVLKSVIRKDDKITKEEQDKRLKLVDLL